MDITEIQNLIDAKDWDSLSETEILKGYDYNATFWQNLQIPKEIMWEFFFNKERYTRAYTAASEPYHDDIFKHLNAQINVSSFEMSVQDWTRYAEGCMDLLSFIPTSDITSLCRWMFGFANKDVNYLRIFKNKKLLEKISNKKYYMSQSQEVRTSLIEDLTPEEAKEIGYRTLGLNGIMATVRFSAEAIAMMHKFFDSYKETYEKLHNVPNFRSIEIGFILGDLSKDDFETYIEKNYPKIDSEFEADSITTYYRMKDHKDIEIGDKILEKIIGDVYSSRQTHENIISNMNKEQITKYAEKMFFNVLVQSKLSLDELVEIRPDYETRNSDLSSSKFFTEEEIIAHPNLFDPESYKPNPKSHTSNSRAYISKDTYRLMNKAWGKRQRWAPELVNFDEILQGVHYRDLTIDVIKYLMEKTGTPNEAMPKLFRQGVIGKGSTMHAGNQDAKTLQRIKNFLQKYE